MLRIMIYVSGHSSLEHLQALVKAADLPIGAYVWAIGMDFPMDYQEALQGYKPHILILDDVTAGAMVIAKEFDATVQIVVGAAAEELGPVLAQHVAEVTGNRLEDARLWSLSSMKALIRNQISQHPKFSKRR